MTAATHIPALAATGTPDALLAINDSYTCHVRQFAHFLEANHLALDYDAVKAYFSDLNASTLAAGTKRVRRQAVKARMRLAIQTLSWEGQAQAEMQMKALDLDLH